jgi:hypothetical protein
VKERDGGHHRQVGFNGAFEGAQLIKLVGLPSVKQRPCTAITELDVVVAASTTRFAQIEIKRGIFPFGGATFRLPQRVGWGNAMRWLLTGDEFGADEAHRIGLVQEVVEAGKQLEYVHGPMQYRMP